MHLYICALLYKCIIIQLHIIQFVWKIKVQKVEKGWNLPLGWDVCRASLKRRCRFLEVPFRPCFYIQEHKPKYHNRKSFQNWTNQITEFRATETKKLSATFKSQNLIKFIVTVRSKLRSHVSWWITWLFLSIFLGEKVPFSYRHRRTWPRLMKWLSMKIFVIQPHSCMRLREGFFPHWSILNGHFTILYFTESIFLFPERH